MQFCRMYSGTDGKSHFEELEQNAGSKLFLTSLPAKTLVFKNDMNREDLHGWHNAPRRQWCITLSGWVEIGIGDVQRGEGAWTKDIERQSDLLSSRPAAVLGRLAKDCGAFVNLIPLHPGGALEFQPSTRERTVAFARELRRAGVEVAIRKSRGVDIAAACGQLRVERLRRRRPVGAEQHGDVHVA